MCGCSDNCGGVYVICVFVFTAFCIVCTVFEYCFVYSYLFYLYYCKDYCHRVKTQLQKKKKSLKYLKQKNGM